MTPRILLRTAALNALAAAAAIVTDPDCAPLARAQMFLGQTWPSQSPAPGQGPLPIQLLIYCWDDDSETVGERTTAPKFATTMTLMVEGRFETTTQAAISNLAAPPFEATVYAAVDSQLDLLMFAVKKAICQGIGVAAMALNGNKPVIDGIKNVKTTSKYAMAGQRIAANGAVAVELQYGEYFEPLLANALTELDVLIGAEAGAVANSGNIGNGTISAVTVGIGAQPGDYAVALTSATAFTVTRPDSSLAGTGTVGTVFSGGGLTFTVSAGRVAYAAGDGFTVPVQVAAQTKLNLSS